MVGEKGIPGIETVGKKIDKIQVKISYRIIELFSGGLYSSPNKAFEELVCNSYDAFATTVAVRVPFDLSPESASIWVCDNGEGMNQNDMKQLWNIGESAKRTSEREKRRLQIGKFGIGKLATYVLARKLTYVSKKSNKFMATTMDYGRIKEGVEQILLDEREVSEEEARDALDPYIYESGKYLLPFQLFGENAEENWTFALLSNLKAKAREIKPLRLKWILETALPNNPEFIMYLNSEKIVPSKEKVPIKKIWVVGENDRTAEKMKLGITQGSQESPTFVDFPTLEGVHGRFELYEDSLDKGKSTQLGRSHGIFLVVRGRLINLYDPLLGMAAFSHGPFNKSRIVIYADNLDPNITSTRESIKEGSPLNELKTYIQRKFDNEVRPFYFEEENKKEFETSLSYRISQTPLSISKQPLLKFATKYYNSSILNPFLIEKPPSDKKDELLQDLQKEITEDDTIIKNAEWEAMGTEDPIAKLDLESGQIKINLLHPFIANYSESFKNLLPLQFVAVTEILTEAHLYELDIDEEKINQIMHRRDNLLRRLSLSDRKSIPIVARMLNDAINDSSGLEESLYNAFLALGFDASKIGGPNEPDGIANAYLGFRDDKELNYSLVFDAKSTKKEKISGNTAQVLSTKRHKEKYKANFGVVVAIDFEGYDDPNSKISFNAKDSKISAMRIKDLVRLLFLWAPHQIGLSKLKDLFERAYTPKEITDWVDAIEAEPVRTEPYKELLEAIFYYQKTDFEAPDVTAVRLRLNDGRNQEDAFSKQDIKKWVSSLSAILPGFVEIDGEYISIKGKPDDILEMVHNTIQSIPMELQDKYLAAFKV